MFPPSTTVKYNHPREQTPSTCGYLVNLLQQLAVGAIWPNCNAYNNTNPSNLHPIAVRSKC